MKEKFWSPDFRIAVSYHKSIAGILCYVSVSTDHNNFHHEGFMSLDDLFKVIEKDIKDQLEGLKVLTRIVHS